MQKFLSDNACKIYDLKFKEDKILTLEEKEWQVPNVYEDKYNQVVPYMTGEILKFQLKH